MWWRREREREGEEALKEDEGGGLGTEKRGEDEAKCEGRMGR